MEQDNKMRFQNFKIKTKAVYMLLLVVLMSCADNITSTNKENKAQQRIYAKESTVYNGCDYHIIEVDGVEYLASYGGGICPLVKNNQ